ncbi:hypothetical protein [Olsenella uli]|uniref:hypothetical protein n=1 Tax=Olsenella uli TaxID=133926 RepID=UPI00241C3A62|nr:hypothetical protein [Olsenella uli]
MSESTQRLFGLAVIIISIFLLIGGLYLPSGFMAEPLKTTLAILGAVLLIGGNLVMALARSEE